MRVIDYRGTDILELSVSRYLVKREHIASGHVEYFEFDTERKAKLFLNTVLAREERRVC